MRYNNLNKESYSGITFSIIGAGNGGRAFAVYLAKHGHRVNLLFHSPDNIKTIWYTRKIRSKCSEAEYSGIFNINMVTHNYEQAIQQSDIILYVIPANLHEKITYKIAPYLHDGQIILLNPGRMWGAIEVKMLLQQLRQDIRIFVGETQTLLFTCRKVKDYGVRIKKIKNRVDFCFYPEEDNYIVSGIISEIFPQLHCVDNIFMTSLNNIGAVIHPAITILNSGAIFRKNSFNFYYQGITPFIANVVEKIDSERLNIIRELGIPVKSLSEWVEETYGVDTFDIENYYELFQKVPEYRNITAPSTLDMRYITEDIPTGLVPMVSLADYLDIPVPTMKSIINIANIMFDIDFYKTGRTLISLRFPFEIFSKQFEDNGDIYESDREWN